MNDPAWFVAALLPMYLIFYYVTKKAQKNHSQDIIAWIAVMILGFLLGSYEKSSAIPFFGYSVGGYRALIFFSLGAIIYYINDLGPEYSRFLTRCATVTLVMAVIGPQILDARDFFGWEGNPIYNTIVFCIIPSILIICVNCDKLNSMIGNSKLYRLESLSYPLFLCHYPANILFAILHIEFGMFDFSSERFFVFRFAVLILLSVLIHLHVDQNHGKKQKLCRKTNLRS